MILFHRHYFFENYSGIHITIYVFTFINLILSLVIMGLGSLWLVYYVRKSYFVTLKIRSYKDPRNHNQNEILTNCKVEFVKSTLISIISFLEINMHLTIWVWSVVKSFYWYEKNDKDEHNSGDYVRIISASLPLILITLVGSLVCILTSYLSKAYSVKREVEFREKVLFFWIFVQLVPIICFIPVLKHLGFEHLKFFHRVFYICVFVNQIVVYSVLSRKLYLKLVWRKMDAYFEDITLHRKLIKMCRDFKRGSILYLVALILGLVYLILATLECINHIQTKETKETKGKITSEDKLLNNVLRLVNILFLSLLFGVSLWLHLSVFVSAVRRLFTKSSVFKLQNKHKQNYVPLIGEN